LALVAAATAVRAQDMMRIVAIVNEDVVSAFDLEARVAMAIYSTNLPNTPEMRSRLVRAVLRNLVDEILQVQEALRQGVRVRDTEIVRAMEEIEANIGAPPGGLGDHLAQVGIPLSAVESQVRAQIVWGKFVNQRLRPTLDVSDEEINAELERLEASRGMPEYLLSEIDLHPDASATDRALMATATDLVAQLRGGADFGGVAAQFSQGALARAGGDLGWLREGQSRPEIDAALAGMAIGDISDPIRTLDAIHILYLRDKRRVLEQDKREVEVYLSQILLPAEAGEAEGAAAARLAQAAEIAVGISGCDALRERAAGIETGLSGDLGWLRLGDLPPVLRDAVAELPVGEPSAPQTTESGVHVLMACERNDPDTEGDLRDAIYEQIALRRLSTMERRMIRNLRQVAFVELRERADAR
jgi:peptidyl-prolyl cis-trans isomerase SurA